MTTGVTRNCAGMCREDYSSPPASMRRPAGADANGKLVGPQGSSVYSYNFVITRHNSPFAEFLMMAPQADTVVPMFSPQLLDEQVPVNGRMKVSALDAPGFGVRLNPECTLHRPYPR